MPAIDRINRKGLDGRRVLLGPARLNPPRGSLTPGNAVGGVIRISGPNDQYEVTTTGTGVTSLAFTAVVKPYSELGFPRSTSKLGMIGVIRQPNGLNAPNAGTVCLGARRHASTTSTTTLGPYTVNSTDRVWIVVEEEGNSNVKYQLELLADFITISAQPPNRSVAAPTGTTFTITAATNDSGTLSYQWQISTDAGVTFGNLSNGGVYSGATTATLTISNSTGLNGRRYRCLVSSSLTAPTATSNSGTLTVT